MTQPTERSSRARSRALPLLVAGCFFMENLDATIVSTAAPSIGRDLRVDATSVGLAITAYVMTVAVLIPLSGWLSRRFGDRRVLLTAIAIFTLASAVCATSTSLEFLVVARVMQGIGGAMMVPVGRMTVLRTTAKQDLIRAVALLTWPALAAPVIAPFLGGILTTYLSWHWVFLVNLPIGIVGFAVALRVLPRQVHPDALPERPPAPDWLGFSLISSGIACLVWASTLLTLSPIDSVQAGAFAASGIALVALATWHLLRTRNPLIDLRLLRVHTFGVAVGGGSGYRFVISAIPFVLPLLFQRGFGWTPVAAGTAVLFLFAGNLGIKPATTWMLRTFGFRRVIVASHLLGVACLVGMAFFTATTSFVVIALVLVISGVARSTGFTAYNTITYADVEPGQVTDANVLDSTVQQIAVGLGVAFGAVAISAGVTIATAAGGMVADGYRLTFAALAIMMLGVLVPAWRLSSSAGRGLITTSG